MIDSLTCSNVHLCHFVGVTMLCSFHVHAWMGFYNSQMFMVQCTISPTHFVLFTVLLSCGKGCAKRLYNLRECLTKPLRTNHEDRIVPVGCCLWWGSSASRPFLTVTFMGETLANHSYVNKLVLTYKTYIIIPYL